MFDFISTGSGESAKYAYIQVFIDYLYQILEMMMNFISKINLPSFTSAENTTAAPSED